MEGFSFAVVPCCVVIYLYLALTLRQIPKKEKIVMLILLVSSARVMVVDIFTLIVFMSGEVVCFGLFGICWMFSW